MNKREGGRGWREKGGGSEGVEGGRGREGVLDRRK